MKKIQLTLILFLFCVSAFSKERIIERPAITACNTKILEFSRILLNDTATILEINAYYTPNFWIQIPRETYLKAGDKKIQVRNGDGIQIGEKFWMPATGEASFKLIFPPLPKGIKEIDFCEGDDVKGGWFFWGIRLDGKHPEVQIDKQWKTDIMPEGNTLPAYKSEKGTAILSGKIIGYKPEMSPCFSLRCSPTFTSQYNVPFTINNDGTFHQEVEVYGTSMFIFTTGNSFSNFFLQPGEQTEMLVNLPEIARESSRISQTMASYGSKFSFCGSLAGVNNLYQTNIRIKEVNGNSMSEILNTIKDMSVSDYIVYCLNLYTKYTKDVQQIPGITPAGIQLLNIRLQADIMNMISNGPYYLTEAYKKANNIGRNDPMPKDYIYPRYTEQDYSFLTDFSINSPYFPNLTSIASNLKYEQAFRAPYNQDNLYLFLLESGKMDEEETTLLNSLLKKEPESQTRKDSLHGKKMMDIRYKHDDLFQAYSEQLQSQSKYSEILANYLGTNQGPLFTAMKTIDYQNNIYNFTPLTEKDIAAIRKLGDKAAETYFTDKNQELLVKIEENKKKSGYSIGEIPDVDKDLLLETIISQYKGKVLFIDFWATWCAPCIMAMEQAEPVKAALAGKDIIYIYLTGETSPLQAWRNKITDIQGIHYRFNNDQWGHLCEKYGAQGVPSYMIVNKEGKQVHFQVGFMGASNMKEWLLRELNK